MQNKIIRVYHLLYPLSSTNMFVTNILGRCIGTQLMTPLRRLHISRSLSSSKDESSDSSETSDSDSDANKAKQQMGEIKENKETLKESSEMETKLYNVLESMMNKKVQNTVDIKHPIPQKLRTQKSEQPLTYEENLQKAAGNVADVLGKHDKDKSQIKWTLLNKLSTGEKAKEVHSTPGISDLISHMKVKDKQSSIKPKQERKLNVNQTYSSFKPNKDSVSALLRNKKQQKYVNILYNVDKELNIFKNISDENANVPKLPTWDALEKKQLYLATSPPPANGFQEMIKWTEEGKLWKFPIDNEQDMEKEHSVHFSEHVFLERHLTEWCPRKGPIRHFMELVCVGLSKNPYMTVEEKREHIFWYKQYFADKENMLKDIHEVDVQEQKPPELM